MSNDLRNKENLSNGFYLRSTYTYIFFAILFIAFIFNIIVFCLNPLANKFNLSISLVILSAIFMLLIIFWRINNKYLFIVRQTNSYYIKRYLMLTNMYGCFSMIFFQKWKIKINEEYETMFKNNFQTESNETFLLKLKLFKLTENIYNSFVIFTILFFVIISCFANKQLAYLNEFFWIVSFLISLASGYLVSYFYFLFLVIYLKKKNNQLFDKQFFCLSFIPVVNFYLFLNKY